MDDLWKMPAQRLRCAPVNFRGFLFLAFVSVAVAQGDGSALGALKSIPQGAAKRLARIEGRDAVAVPERWYFIVHDPALPRGMREFVVAGGKVVASRELSQFAETVSATDVVGSDAVKLDSDRVARLATLFAGANGGKVGSVNFELSRDVVANAPVWRATVLDPVGDQLGVVTVHALKGELLSHDGFENEPSAELLNAVLPAQGASSRTATGGRAQPTVTRVARPSPTPKPNLIKRLFGADEGKPPKPAR